MKFILLSGILICTPLIWAQFDEPDYAYESQLHDIYLNYHKEKTSYEDWSSMVGDRVSETYTIQKGDTLWEISKTFFGDGNYWPKIWSVNGKITNPHLIKENNTISFLLGDASGAPAFSITESPTSIPVYDTSGELSQLRIPPSSTTSKPVVTELPASLPDLTGLNRTSEYDDLGFSYMKRPIVKVEDTIPLAALITEGAPQYSGKVVEGEIAELSAGPHQYVYVAVDPAVAKVGERMLIIRNEGPVEFNSSSLPEVRTRPYRVKVIGELEITDETGQSLQKDKQKWSYYKALIIKADNQVRQGDLLQMGRYTNVRVTQQGPRSDVVAEIISGINGGRAVIHPRAFLFLDRGKEAGLSSGDILPIRANRSKRHKNSKLKGATREIGLLRIVETTPHFSLALVVDAWEEIYPGDVTGARGLHLNDEGSQPATPVNDLEKGLTFDEIEDDFKGNELTIDEGGPEFSFDNEVFGEDFNEQLAPSEEGESVIPDADLSQQKKNEDPFAEEGFDEFDANFDDFAKEPESEGIQDAPSVADEILEDIQIDEEPKKSSKNENSKEESSPEKDSIDDTDFDEFENESGSF